MESWNAGYDKAHDLFDEEKYPDVIKLLKEFLSDPGCPKYLIQGLWYFSPAL
jgi:hypothetical protein